ncbi:MAG: GTPase HflX [FCB group bacterium]|nr:GTPase HflX [FCB group bacterium]
MNPDLSVNRENAILVGVIHGHNDAEKVQLHMDELALLADTAGADIAGRVVQKLSRINPSFFVGKGKAEQIVHQAQELNCQLIIFDDDLNPGQVKNFQKLSESIKVIDRSALILDIFRKHAKTRESKTQVELAHLQYLLPRLTRMWTHLERQMGGIGTRAGAGETQIEVDRRLIRNRIAHLKKELVRIGKERTIQTKRRENGFRVALVGYTNAGKSTLMNALTGAEVYIQDQLFATLDTTVRKVQLDESRIFFLSDTVGFIRKLPHHLVASFRSTLAEVTHADLILIVLDASSTQLQEHLDTIMSVLKDLEADRENHVLILNKIDLIDDAHHVQRLRNQFPEAIMVSARNHLRLDKLLLSVAGKIDQRFITAEVEIPFHQGKNIALAQDGVEVLHREVSASGIRLTIRGLTGRVNQILHTVSEL